MSDIGSLEDFKIVDVLKLFASGRKSGLLMVKSGEQTAEVWFAKGTIVAAQAGRFRGDEAVIDLFGWKSGALSFLTEERTTTSNVTKDVDALIQEGQSVGESFHRIRSQIPSERVIFEPVEEPAEDARHTIDPVCWRVLRALDGLRDVRELVEASKVPRNDVHRVLVDLFEAGFLRKVDTQKVLRVQAQGVFGKDSAGLDELVEQEWMKVSRFAEGVHRIEVRSLGGKKAILTAGFRSGVYRDVQLPRTTVADLNVREGEDVFVRPIS